MLMSVLSVLMIKCWRNLRIMLLLTKFSKAPEVMFIDNRQEYSSSELQRLLKEKGIEHDASMPYIPQQNGSA